MERGDGQFAYQLGVADHGGAVAVAVVVLGVEHRGGAGAVELVLAEARPPGRPLVRKGLDLFALLGVELEALGVDAAGGPEAVLALLG